MYLGASLYLYFVQYAAGIAALFYSQLSYIYFIVYTIHSTLSFMSLIGLLCLSCCLVYVYDRDGVYHHQAL
ncbi:hypothetical protein PO124_19915 [Bacillus licheniformis]|nr:hypothetical protein [Bacillus licheniformis]